MRKYVTTHNNAAKRGKWGRVVYKVTMRDDGSEFESECRKLEHMGMLCCQVLRVMDVLHLEEIPAKHIVKRWTKDARDILPRHLMQYQKDQSVSKSFTSLHAGIRLFPDGRRERGSVLAHVSWAGGITGQRSALRREEGWFGL